MFVPFLANLLTDRETRLKAKSAAITITQWELVEVLHPEYAHAYSTNRGRAFLTFSFSFSLSWPVWPGLYEAFHTLALAPALAGYPASILKTVYTFVHDVSNIKRSSEMEPKTRLGKSPKSLMIKKLSVCSYNSDFNQAYFKNISWHTVSLGNK